MHNQQAFTRQVEPQAGSWKAHPAQNHAVFEASGASPDNASNFMNPSSELEPESAANSLSEWLEKSKISSTPETPAEDASATEQPVDDFIAAARRAAQAASQKGVLGAMSPGLGKAVKSPRKGFKLPFLKGAPPAAAVVQSTEKLPPQIKPVKGENNNKRTTLLLAGLLLLAAVSAFTMNMLGKSETQAPAPVSMENPAKPAQQSSLEKMVAPLAIVPTANQSNVDPVDGILTGSLPVQKADASLSSIVAEPGSTANQPEMPPEELGTLALRQAAERGDAEAQFIIATRYLDGDGAAQDVTRAAHWYQKAASAGLAPAQYRLATLFERGRGAPKDVSTALVWYQRAADQGNVKSMHNAAVIAAGTEAGPANYEVAFKWFLAASQNGLKDSQFNLAVLYERGLGTRPDPKEALFWYMIAAAQNDADAQKRVDILSKSLPSAAVDAIHLKALSWIPLQAPINANVVTIKDAAWQQGNPQAQTSQISTAPQTMATAADPVGKTQELLTKLGFNVGEPDGKMGTRTTNAIRLFQLQSGIKVDGEVTPDLINKLQAKLG
jgi:localization factor PodJL